VVQQDLSGVRLRASTARLHGPNIDLESDGNEDVLDNWLSEDDNASWQFKIVQPAIFRILMTYRVESDGLDGEYEVLLNDKVINTSSVQQGADKRFVTDEHVVPIKRPDTYTLTVRPRRKPGKKLMILQTILLAPEN